MQEHNYSQNHAVAKARTSHVGRNNQTRFWCGFCGDVIVLNRNGVEAWDERYSHIDAHFIREELDIDNWVDGHGHDGKGHETKSMLKLVADNKSNRSGTSPSYTAGPAGSASYQSGPSNSNKRARSRSVESSRSQKRARATSGFSANTSAYEPNAVWSCVSAAPTLDEMTVS
jgi:hypothetical protein